MSSQSLQPILALMGCPVGGNPIQYMTEKAFAHHGLDWRYLSLEISPEDLADAVRGMKVMGFFGGNCAAPHEETIGPFLDGLGRTAELTGVVNLIRREDDKLIGENTEGRALVELLHEPVKLAGRNVVLLGAGRMAKAVAVELATAGVAQMTIVDRDEVAAADLAGLIAEKLELPATAVLWEGDYAAPPETDLVFCDARVTGVDPEARAAVDVESLTSRLTVADATLDSPSTWLLDEARARGCRTLNGVDLFTTQILLNFRTWTGVEPERALLREALEEFLEL